MDKDTCFAGMFELKLREDFSKCKQDCKVLNTCFSQSRKRIIKDLAKVHSEILEGIHVQKNNKKINGFKKLDKVPDGRLRFDKTVCAKCGYSWTTTLQSRKKCPECGFYNREEF